MSVSLSPWLKPRFFITGTNRPLAGGLMYTYEAGTTTNATTYSDDSGTPNANPIVLNSDGECNLYLDDDVIYRIILKNAAGVTQFDKDNISSNGAKDAAVLSFENVANLRLAIGNDREPTAQTSGYYNAGDGGGNSFYWNGTSALTDNGGTVIKPTLVSGAGRWLAINSVELNPLQFGCYGDGSSDDTVAMKAMLSCGASIFDFLDKTYKIATTNGANFSSFTSKTKLTIKGEGALLTDTTTHTSSGLTIIFSLDACSNVDIYGVNYKGEQLASPSDSTKGIGYKGATFVNLKNACSNVKVKAFLTDARYGVRSGDYSISSEGYSYNLDIDITGLRVGYTSALYLAQDFRIYSYSVDGHRAVYLAGCQRGEVNAYVKNQYIAPIQVLLTDAKTGTGTSRGCANINTNVRDMGSTTYVANSWLCGIAPSRVDSGTTYSDLHFHVYLKSTDTVAATLGAFVITSSAKAFEVSYPYNWEQTIYLKNISVSGLIDRSEQTTATHGIGEVYVSTIDTGTHYATSSGFNFNQLKIINGAGSNPRVLYFLLDGLTDSCVFNQCFFGNYALECRAPVTGWPVGFIFNDCNTITKATTDTSSAVPFAFNNTNISDLTQPLAYAKMNSSTVKSAGLRTITIVKDITLTGASVSFVSFIPAGATVIGVSGIVLTDITGATGYQVGVAAEAARYCDSNVITHGSTFTPANQSATELAPRFYLAFTHIYVTAKTSNFTGGSMRVALTYTTISAPTL
jgi:hypothetical protein